VCGTKQSTKKGPKLPVGAQMLVVKARRDEQAPSLICHEDTRFQQVEIQLVVGN